MISVREHETLRGGRPHHESASAGEGRFIALRVLKRARRESDIHPQMASVEPLVSERAPVGTPAPSGALFDQRQITAADLFVVIPMYNEAQRIGATLKLLAESPLNRADVQILFVDDGSSDGTAEAVVQFAQGLGFARPIEVSLDRQNRGKGAAVRRGMLLASERNPRHVAFLDADLSLDPAVLDAAVTSLVEARASVIVGNRVVERAQQPPVRRAVSLAFKQLTGWIAPTGVADTQCACKVFTRDAVQQIFEPLQTNGFAFDVEVLLRARRARLAVVEMDVQWRHTQGSRVNPAVEAFRMTRDVLRIRRLL